MSPTASSTPAASLETLLTEAVAEARSLTEGAPAAYIPELAQVDPELTSVAVVLPDGTAVVAGDAARHRFTVQSSAKVVLLAGLLEELGEERVFSLVGAEPSGGSFASIARLETHDPKPANPLVNPGAIALCSLIPGDLPAKLGWLETWTERLYGARLRVNSRVFASERTTGDRNRAIAWFLKSQRVLQGSVEEILDTYFTLCSFEASVIEVARLGAVLALGGAVPGVPAAPPILSRRTAGAVVALMATCGMYDESGTHLLETGMPAKSGVSGVILAVVPHTAGVAVASPRVNAKGGSVRGHRILRTLARRTDWHFAV
jgi:glutaminase